MNTSRLIPLITIIFIHIANAQQRENTIPNLSVPSGLSQNSLYFHFAHKYYFNVEDVVLNFFNFMLTIRALHHEHLFNLFSHSINIMPNINNYSQSEPVYKSSKEIFHFNLPGLICYAAINGNDIYNQYEVDMGNKDIRWKQRYFNFEKVLTI